MNNLMCLAGSALLLSCSTAALAVNYPTEVRISVGVSDVRPPELLLNFNNNEGDRVKFDYEVTIDGVALPPSGVTDSLRCVYHSADGNDCKGAIRANLREPWTTEKGLRAVVMGPVKFDTDYCLRVIAVDDRARRSPWSAWACAHTPALPARPTFHSLVPQITVIDAGSTGRGQVGGATPARVLIEWTMDTRGVGWYAVERSRAGPAAWSEVGRVNPPQNGVDVEFVEIIKDLSNVPGPDNRTSYRVCAANIGGKTCSASRTYPMFDVKQAVVQSPVQSHLPQASGVTTQVKSQVTSQAASQATSQAASQGVSQSVSQAASAATRFAALPQIHATAPAALSPKPQQAITPALGSMPAASLALDWNKAAPSAFSAPSAQFKRP